LSFVGGWSSLAVFFTSIFYFSLTRTNYKYNGEGFSFFITPLAPSISNPYGSKVRHTIYVLGGCVRHKAKGVDDPTNLYQTWAGLLISITIDDQFLDIKSGEKFYTSVEYEYATNLLYVFLSNIEQRSSNIHSWGFRFRNNDLSYSKGL
jgi:hypothetical protein